MKMQKYELLSKHALETLEESECEMTGGKGWDKKGWEMWIIQERQSEGLSTLKKI